MGGVGLLNGEMAKGGTGNEIKMLRNTGIEIKSGINIGIALSAYTAIIGFGFGIVGMPSAGYSKVPLIIEA